MAKYIIEIEDVPSMYEDGFTFFKCVDAPWWYISDMHIKRLKPYEVAKRKTGRWNCSDDMFESAVCSVCGWDTTEPWNHIRHWFNYCPKCGAKMEEGGE